MQDNKEKDAVQDELETSEEVVLLEDELPDMTIEEIETAAKAQKNKGGRPRNPVTGKELKARAAAKKRKKKPTKILFQCLSCGTNYAKSQFYTKKVADTWWDLVYPDIIPYCKDCILKKFEYLKKKYVNEESALIVICHACDIPFIKKLYETLVEGDKFTLVEYIRCSGLPQYQNYSFEKMIVFDEFKNKNIGKKNDRNKWVGIDAENRDFVISVAGFDPFSSSNYTDLDKKFCYNVMASYCEIDGLSADGHKLQAVIAIVRSQLQLKHIDDLITIESMMATPDEHKLQKLTASKKAIQSTIDQSSRDNQIASAYNKSGDAATNTLSYKIKEMSQWDFEDSKINLFTIKTSEAMKQIADLSNQSILEQIELDENDYTKMLNNQREVIEKLTAENEVISEKLRVFQNDYIKRELKGIDKIPAESGLV